MIRFKSFRFGTLSAIATLLVFSAGFRLLGISGVAFALEQQEVGGVIDETPASMSEPVDPDLERLLASFQTREQALKEEEEALVARAQKLDRVQAAVAAKITELETTEQRLRDLLAIADDAAEDDVAQLTTVYENMKPKAAATVFEKMPPAFAAGFLSRMRPESAALVMASLPPDAAYAISVVFAGRNAENPTK